MIKQMLYAVLCLICVTGNNLFAQEGSSAAGGDGAGPGGTISYTVGQTNYITLAGAGGTATEGVQQPFEFSDPCDGIIAEITAGGPTTFCKLDSVILTISNLEPGDSYSWFKDGNMIPGAAGSDYAAMHTGDYTAQVITDGGCYIMSSSISITTDPNPKAAIRTPDGTDLCDLTNVRFKANGGIGGSLTYQWYKDGEVLPGETANIYEVTEIGDYSVLVTNSFGCSTMSLITTVINSCKIGEYTERSGRLSLYPNPALYEFMVVLNLSNPINEMTDINLYNVSGYLVYTQAIEVKDGSINEQVILRTKIPSGLYLVEIVAGNSVYTQQLLIQD